MNARRFERHLEYWAGLQAFREVPERREEDRRVTEAKAWLKRASRRARSGR